MYHSAESDVAYDALKDSVGFLIAVPAAWLAYCFQARASYLGQLRSVWSYMIEGLQAAERYTFLEEPTAREYADARATISKAIDEVRGVFKNVENQRDTIGWYPFEPMKQMLREIESLGYGPGFKRTEAEKLRRELRKKYWDRMSRQFLKEIDRDHPTFHHSQYVE